MSSTFHAVIGTPIMMRCIILNKMIYKFTEKTPNRIKHPYVDELKRDGMLLVKYARRQLVGKDYYNRVIELLDEIRSETCLILALGGLTEVSSVKIDTQCEDILGQLKSYNPKKERER